MHVHDDQIVSRARLLVPHLHKVERLLPICSQMTLDLVLLEDSHDGKRIVEVVIDDQDFDLN